jgi:hypothetical protein
MLKELAGGIHPSPAHLAELIEAGGGVIPPDALQYVLERLRGEVQPPSREPKKSLPNLEQVGSERSIGARYWRLYLRRRYRRRRDAYARLRRSRPLKPKNRLEVNTFPPAELALRRLARSLDIGEDSLRNIIHSAS